MYTLTLRARVAPCCSRLVASVLVEARGVHVPVVLPFCFLLLSISLRIPACRVSLCCALHVGSRALPIQLDSDPSLHLRDGGLLASLPCAPVRSHRLSRSVYHRGDNCVRCSVSQECHGVRALESVLPVFLFHLSRAHSHTGAAPLGQSQYACSMLSNVSGSSPSSAHSALAQCLSCPFLLSPIHVELVITPYSTVCLAWWAVLRGVESRRRSPSLCGGNPSR